LLRSAIVNTAKELGMPQFDQDNEYGGDHGGGDYDQGAPPPAPGSELPSDYQTPDTNVVYEDSSQTDAYQYDEYGGDHG
jgi:hypothetical protein